MYPRNTIQLTAKPFMILKIYVGKHKVFALKSV